MRHVLNADLSDPSGKAEVKVRVEAEPETLRLRSKDGLPLNISDVLKSTGDKAAVWGFGTRSTRWFGVITRVRGGFRLT